MQPVIVTVCGDPGGANALAPVIKLLQHESQIQVINYTYYEAKAVLKRHHLLTQTLPGKANAKTALKILQNHHANFLLTATSVNDQDWEKLFIIAARQLAIHSVAILDFWSNYVARFSQEKKRLNCLPDKIAVMDNYAQISMIRAGFCAENIMITGQPAFDSLHSLRAQFSDLKRNALRQALGVGGDDLLLSFVSQPLRKCYGSPSGHHYLGYDEHSTLIHIINTLETLQATTQKEIMLLILPHPKEIIDDFNELTSDKIKIVIMQHGNHHQYLMASDLVLGMSSILLVEACYLACVVLSVQIGLNCSDVLITNQSGASLLVKQKEELLPVIERYLFDSNSRVMLLDKSIPFMGSAANHIVNYIDHFFKN